MCVVLFWQLLYAFDRYYPLQHSDTLQGRKGVINTFLKVLSRVSICDTLNVREVSMVSWPTNPNTWLFLTEPIPFTASCFTSYPHLRMISFLVMLKCQTETREHSLSPFLPRPRCRAVLHVSKYFSKKIIIFGSRCDNSVRLLRGAGRGGTSVNIGIFAGTRVCHWTGHSGTFLATVTQASTSRQRADQNLLGFPWENNSDES